MDRKRKRSPSASPSPAANKKKKGRSSYRKKTWKELRRVDSRKGRNEKRKIRKTNKMRSAAYKKRKNRKRREANWVEVGYEDHGTDRLRWP